MQQKSAGSLHIQINAKTWFCNGEYRDIAGVPYILSLKESSYLEVEVIWLGGVGGVG